MSLYLSPHSLAIADAVRVARSTGLPVNVVTVAEAVGSDVTNVVRACVENDQFGAAAHVLSSYLEHDVCLAVSDYTRELIISEAAAIDAKHGTTFAAQCRERVTVSYPAVDVGSYLNLPPSDVLSSRGLTPDGYVLFLSRLAHAKGVDDLIAGFAASRAAASLRLVIAGNGPDAARLRSLAAASSAADRITFLDDVDDAEKAHLMAGSAAYVLPSKPRPEFVETFGIALVEKMLAGGGPVITTDTGGIGEAVGDCALIVPVESPSAIAAALDRVLVDVRRRARGLGAPRPRARPAVRPRRRARRHPRPRLAGPDPVDPDARRLTFSTAPRHHVHASGRDDSRLRRLRHALVVLCAREPPTRAELPDVRPLRRPGRRRAVAARTRSTCSGSRRSWATTSGWVRVRHLEQFLSSPFPLFGAIAQATDRIRFGTAVLPMRYADPITIAEDAATVDLLSGGRLELGVAGGIKPSAEHPRRRSTGACERSFDDESQHRIARLRAAIAGEPVAVAPETGFPIAPPGTELIVRPHSPGLADRVWYGPGSKVDGGPHRRAGDGPAGLDPEQRGRRPVVRGDAARPDPRLQGRVRRPRAGHRARSPAASSCRASRPRTTSCSPSTSPGTRDGSTPRVGRRTGSACSAPPTTAAPSRSIASLTADVALAEATGLDIVLPAERDPRDEPPHPGERRDEHRARPWAGHRPERQRARPGTRSPQRPVTRALPVARSRSAGRIVSPATRRPSCRYSLVIQTCAFPRSVASARSRST